MPIWTIILIILATVFTMEWIATGSRPTFPKLVFTVKLPTVCAATSMQ